MSRKWNRSEIWWVVIAVLGVLFSVILGLPRYMKYTATVLHPQPQNAPSSTRTEPAPSWGPAVSRSREIVRAGLSEQNVPGLSVAVGVGNEIVWAEGFGWADIDKRLPVAPETRFRIGTASMVLTSAAVGRLLEKGRLKLDDPIQTYVPEFPPMQWPVTLRHLLAHTSGVRSDSGDEGPLFSQHCERPVEALPHFADRPLLFEPGTEYRHSKYGYILISAAVEAAAKQPFLTFMEKEIFQPLGMRDTLAESATKDIPDRSTFYFPRFGADPRYGLHLMRDQVLSCYAGSMVFLSTPSDMVRFGLALNNSKLLQPKTVRLMQASEQLATGKETGYGLGWDLETVTLGGQPTPVVGHDGDSLGGMVVSLVTLPERGIVVAVMSNISYTDTFGLATKVAEAFAEQAKQKPSERRAEK